MVIDQPAVVRVRQSGSSALGSLPAARSARHPSGRSSAATGAPVCRASVTPARGLRPWSDRSGLPLKPRLGSFGREGTANRGTTGGQHGND